MVFINEIGNTLRNLNKEIDSADPAKLKIITRKLAMCEMQVQAVRSLIEARLFEHEIWNEEDRPEQSQESEG